MTYYYNFKVNNFCLWLTIKLFETGEIKWKTCVRRMRLMPSPHKESGSQDYFAISKKQVSHCKINCLYRELHTSLGYYCMSPYP